MDRATNTRDFLAGRRKMLEDSLLEREPALMQEYLEVCSMLQAIGGFKADLVVESMEYAPFRTPLAAVEAFLAKTGRPATKEEIAQAVCAGGYSVLEKRRYWNVIDAISHNLQRSKNKVLAEKDSLVGLTKWNDSNKEEAQ
jgi:phosphoenolpyruvate carboxylase